MSDKIITRSVTSDNQFTDSASIVGHFNVSISGTWDAIVTAQRSFDKGSTWFSVKTWIDNVEEYGFEPERGVHYRIGVKAGEFENGTVVLRLSQ